MPKCVKVLFVDDEQAVLDSLRRSLCRTFDVTTARGPEEGLRVVETRGPFAVVVSDLRMRLTRATSRAEAGKPLRALYPFLQGFLAGDVAITAPDAADLAGACRLVFLAVPHAGDVEAVFDAEPFLEAPAHLGRMGFGSENDAFEADALYHVALLHFLGHEQGHGGGGAKAGGAQILQQLEVDFHGI